MRGLFVTVLLCLLITAGCTHRIADLTYVSSKNISQDELSSAVSDGERVTGEDTAKIIVIIPTGTPNAEEALDRAIEQKPGGLALKKQPFTALGSGYHIFTANQRSQWRAKF